MQPPTWPAPEPPVSDEPSWAPITTPQSVTPPPPPPPPPPGSPTPSVPPAGRGKRVGAAVLAALILLVAGFVFARVTDDTGSAAKALSPSGRGTTAATIDPNTS